GEPRLNAISFTPMPPGDVSAANLTPFDTIVLNMASYAMACSSDTLTDAQKQAIVDAVAAGKKLIIYDSECYPGPDYSWLPFPFSTNNPGAMGASGTLTIVEENTLSSSDPVSSYFIDAAYLGFWTDAVGDMNVMVTFDPYWCIDMSGTNINQVTGPVHTYAKYPAGTDTGLIIYNGLDMDYMPNSALLEIWIQELEQSFNPSNLPCGVTVVGITLSPATDTNLVGESHTVTAKITDQLGNSVQGVDVDFEVLSGPNAGETGVDTTDASGEATFTYTGDGGTGTDVIQACFTNEAGQEVCSQTVEKVWTAETSVPEFPPLAVGVLGLLGAIVLIRKKA
ncbi:MAG TPA: hypothetical protein ENG14_03595, partial [Thermodesulforhabdus norvegica]|nr:hypothetical protein [Thermodesulforhabdus norvegica]